MNFLHNYLHQNPGLRRATRFVSVGTLASVIDLSVFSLLHIILGVPIMAANTISYGAGSINSFSLHRAWTYRDRPQQTLGMQLVQFLVVGIGALLINNLVITIAPHINLINMVPDNGSLAVKACATAAGMVWNFMINNAWTFRRIAH